MMRKIIGFVLIVIFYSVGNAEEKYNFCHSCKYKNVIEAKFCSKCGNKLQKNYKLGFGVGGCEGGFGGFFYIDYFFKNDLSVDINIGLYIKEAYDKFSSYLACYYFPIGIIYQLRNNNIFDPFYIGGGISCLYFYTKGYYVGDYKEVRSVGPFLNLGVNFLANSPFNVIWDIKFFTNFHLSRGSFFVMSIKVGFSW